MTDEISYSQDDSQEKDHFIFTLLCKRNDAEFERSNILDSKASGIIGFAGLIIGLFGTLISFLLGEMSQNTHFMFYYQSYRVFLFMGILSLAVSILSCIFAYTVKTYVIIPKPTALIEKYAKNENKSKIETLQIVGTLISDGITENSKINDEKAKFVKYGLYLFAFGMTLTVIFVCGLLMI